MSEGNNQRRIGNNLKKDGSNLIREGDGEMMKENNHREDIMRKRDDEIRNQ